LPFGNKTLDLTFERVGREIVIRASDPGLQLASRTTGAAMKNGALRVPIPAVEAGISEQLPEPGSETHQIKVLQESYADRSLVLRLSAPGGSREMLSVRENGPGMKLVTSDGELAGAENGIRPLVVRFPAGDGYVEKTVTLKW
jgi:hypothetical protein